MKVSCALVATPEQAWAVVSDLDRWDEMLPTIDEIDRVGEWSTIGVGSRFLVKQPALAAAEYEVTEWAPGRGFTWRARSLGVTTTATHVLTPSAAGCELELGIVWTGPAAVVVRLLFGRRTLKYLGLEMAAFQSILAAPRSE